MSLDPLLPTVEEEDTLVTTPPNCCSAFGSSSASSLQSSEGFPSAELLETLQNARPVHSSLPHEGFSARNEDWTYVQQGVVKLFQKKKMSANDLIDLCGKVKNLVKSEIGPLIYDYCKNQLLKRGMRMLREKIKKEAEEGDLLHCLGETWAYFYMEILPVVQCVLFPVQTKDLSIKQMSLLVFRDGVVLSSELHLDLSYKLRKEQVPPSIQQMFLVLQSVCESDPPSEQFLQLEKLVGQAVVPYLGYQGLFMGDAKPHVPSAKVIPVMPVEEALPESKPDPKMPLSSLENNNKKYLHMRQSSSPLMQLLSPVQEVDAQGRDRRHSVCIT